MNSVMLSLLRKQDAIQSQIDRIRLSCKHPNIEFENKSNTGNWCDADDSYWISIDCLDCGAKITFDSDQVGYTEFTKTRNATRKGRR